MLTYEQNGEILAALAEELEAMAELHRLNMREATDPLVAAENSGISRGLLFVASKLRTAILTAE